MNYWPLYSLLVSLWLVGGSACQHYNEQELQKAQPNNCLIETYTRKSLIDPTQNQPLIDVETVTIGQESFRVTTTQKSAYRYDGQGRIIAEYNRYMAGSYLAPRYTGNNTQNSSDSVFYSYSASAVTIRIRVLSPVRKPDSVQVVVLNAQGLAEIKPFYFQATYDKEGYFVTRKSLYGDVRDTIKILNGNIIERTWFEEDGGPSHTAKYTYDLSKPGLKSVTSFYGKESRNLVSKSTVQENNPWGFPPDVYPTTYGYVFDASGNVKRQLLLAKNVGYKFGNSLEVIVRDYTYICP